jgi:hypothetical protein
VPFLAIRGSGPLAEIYANEQSKEIFLKINLFLFSKQKDTVKRVLDLYSLLRIRPPSDISACGFEERKKIKYLFFNYLMNVTV